MKKSDIYLYFEFLRIRFAIGQKAGEYINYDEEVFERLVIDSNLPIEQETKVLLKKMLDSEFQIYQPDGTALLDDYDHDRNWYSKDKSNIEEYYWKRYKGFLTKKGWNTEILEKLDHDTLDKLMNYLGDPKSTEHFSRKGLVMGDVQSGKTSNYIGLICKAADAGYKVIILLTGTLESLRRQTQIRVEEGFIGYDVENKKWVGVGLNQEDTVIPGSGTSRVNDFTGTAGDNTYLHIKSDRVPIIFVTKKNARVLKRIRESLDKINIKPPTKMIDSSLLIIDDEADNASVNTNKSEEDPTQINAEIRKLLLLFTKTNYVGFTATPFANIFIDPNSENEMLKDDLFPKDFIFSLSAPSHYHGPEKIFLNDADNTIRVIKEDTTTFPLSHKKEWCGNTLFESLKDSISIFLLTNAIRDLREGDLSNSHRSMLINVSRFIKVQEHFEFLIKNYFENIVRTVKYSQNLPFHEYSKNEIICRLFNLFKSEFSTEYSWENVFYALYDSIKDIQIYKFPFTKKGMQLDYEKHEDTGFRVIVIGGLALSRGLTLEGLTVSYLYRNTATFDVLMQMGRWFGYRNKPVEYGDLCRVWMLKKTRDYFKEITTSIRELKDDFNRLVQDKKTPREFGIRVRNESEELGITSRNKMRNSRKVLYTSDLYGKLFETPFLANDVKSAKQNDSIVLKLLSNYDFTQNGSSYFSKNIEKKVIVDFLKDFSIHEANRINYFEKDKIINFIKNFKFTHFDITIVGGNGDKIRINHFEIQKISRVFDTLNSDVIRINRSHYRLGAPGDTQHGLTDSVIKGIKNQGKVSASNFLIESRNPLLLIYPITLKKIDDEEKLNLPYSEVEKISRIADQFNKQIFSLYGIALGIPNNSDVTDVKRTIYYTNQNTKWWIIMNREDNQEDE